MKFINDQYEAYLQEEIHINRKKRIPDSRVHCCIYFIPPTGHWYVSVAALCFFFPSALGSCRRGFTAGDGPTVSSTRSLFSSVFVSSRRLETSLRPHQTISAQTAGGEAATAFPSEIDFGRK